ncbi:MAG: hypothetical protein WBN88_01190 [Anderseniella sp.]
MTLPHYRSVDELLTSAAPDQPVMCFCPTAFRNEAQRFATGFPGDVHYAVKANPHPAVLHWLSDGGVKGFDVASIAEIKLVREQLGDAHCAFNHPVKSRADIASSYGDLGVRDFVIDHDRELAKLADICGRDCTIEVRIAKANPDSAVDLNSKFGCDGQTATNLMRRAGELGFDVAVAMHVGWQAPNPAAWGEAMAMGAGCAEAAGVSLKYANLGGGYPSVLMPKDRRLEDFFDAIKSAKAAHMNGTDLNCEPGSALAWTGGATIAQVHLRKEDSLYLNDGIYGAMNEIKFSAIVPPTTAFNSDGSRLGGAGRAFTVFGPTCDSLDVLPTRIELPDAIDEGDYVVFGWMGAYSNALRTDFNGLGKLSFVTVDAFPA